MLLLLSPGEKNNTAKLRNCIVQEINSSVQSRKTHSKYFFYSLFILREKIPMDDVCARIISSRNFVASVYILRSLPLLNIAIPRNYSL